MFNVTNVVGKLSKVLLKISCGSMLAEHQLDVTHFKFENEMYLWFADTRTDQHFILALRDSETNHCSSLC